MKMEQIFIFGTLEMDNEGKDDEGEVGDEAVVDVAQKVRETRSLPQLATVPLPNRATIYDVFLFTPWFPRLKVLKS